MFVEASYMVLRDFYDLQVYVSILALLCVTSLVSGLIFWRAARRSLRRDSTAKKRAHS